MGKVAIVTDSNSGITQAEGKKMGIYVLPMPFYINEELFYEDITLTQEEFYEKLAVLAVHVRLQSCFPRTMMEKYRS